MDDVDARILDRLRDPAFNHTEYKAIAKQVAFEFGITVDYVYWLPVDHLPDGHEVDFSYGAGWTEPLNRRRAAIEAVRSRR